LVITDSQLLRRREKLREQISQRKMEIEQIDVAGAEDAVKKAEDEVAAKQKKVIGPKLSQQKKLEVSSKLQFKRCND